METIDKVRDVILAEDDHDDVEIFRIAIEKLPVKVQLRHASNGDMLFVLIKEAIPEIIFLDVNMPCRDGINCVIEIRKNKDLRNVPIIMFTGFEFKQCIKDAYENGANFYLLKSANLQQLSNHLEKIFSIDWDKSLYFPDFDRFVLHPGN